MIISLRCSAAAADIPSLSSPRRFETPPFARRDKAGTSARGSDAGPGGKVAGSFVIEAPIGLWRAASQNAAPIKPTRHPRIAHDAQHGYAGIIRPPRRQPSTGTPCWRSLTPSSLTAHQFDASCDCSRTGIELEAPRPKGSGSFGSAVLSLRKEQLAGESISLGPDSAAPAAP